MTKYKMSLSILYSIYFSVFCDHATPPFSHSSCKLLLNCKHIQHFFWSSVSREDAEKAQALLELL